MNKSLHIERQSALRFRRWSRKAYAAFISVNHVVTIGQLATYVSERFQIKNLSLHGWLDCTTGIFAADNLLEDDLLTEDDTLQEGLVGEICLINKNWLPVVVAQRVHTGIKYIII